MTTTANFAPVLLVALGMFLRGHRGSEDERHRLRDGMVAVLTDQEHLREAARARQLSTTTLHRSIQRFRDDLAAVCHAEGLDPKSFIVPHDEMEGEADPP